MAYADISSAPIQQATNSGGNGTSPLVVTLGSPPVNGDFLVACVAIGNDTITIGSITGGGVTWSLAVAQTSLPSGGFNQAVEIWYGPNVSSGGTTIDINPTPSGTKLAANVSEWSGLGLTSVLDQVNSNLANTSTNINTGTIGTSIATELVIGCAINRTADPSSGPTNGFTGLSNFDQDGSLFPEAGYQVESSKGSYSTGWGLTGSYVWEAAIAGFKTSSSFVINNAKLKNAKIGY